MREKIIVIVLLFLIFCLALFLRIYFPWQNVFQEPIRYAADDGVYHMRIVENLLLGGHFPKKIYFDPFTYFPYGTYIHFAPLYDYLLAGIIWVVSLGQPTLELINKIAPFYPAVLGSLTVIVIFFIGKVLWNKWVGLFSAFLIALSQPFLFRSLLGATDHHQAEALFSSLAVLFLVLIFKHHFSFEKKKFLLFTILAGISLGLYFLVYNGALLFLFIIFLSIILYYLIEFLSGRTQDWVLFSGGIMFFITLLMIAPFFEHPDLLRSPLYNINHLGSLILGMLGFLAAYLIGRFIKKQELRLWSLPIFLLLFGIFILAFLKFFFPSLFLGIIESFKTINVGLTTQQGVVGWREVARESIGEMSPLTIRRAFSTFGPALYLSFIALGFIIYNFFKKRKPADLLLTIWFLTMVIITGSIFPAIGQNRFIYYLAAIISLLCGFLAVRGIYFAVGSWKASKEFPLKKYLRFGSALLMFNIIFFVFYPFPLNLIDKFPNNLPMIFQGALSAAISGAIQRESDWYETFKWLKENTPDPGLDYYALYDEPKFNPKTGKIDSYPYPETAYGIMASWDVGHTITYYSHRIPNANPFQQGLGRIEEGEIIAPGETVFFIENDEKKAVEMLETLKTKYVITDYGMALGRGAFYGKPLWAAGGKNIGYYLEEEEKKGVTTRKYDKSMIVRLHYFDGREWQYKDIRESYVNYLDHFRLVYESKTAVAPSYFEEEVSDEKNNIKLVKIFEYVKGAKIKGEAPKNSLVEISTTITTNQDREFIYKKSVEAKDGTFEFIVPYSTLGKDGWLENGTKFEVFAAPYKLKINDIEKEINVLEKDVLEGRVINIKIK